LFPAGLDSEEKKGRFYVQGCADLAVFVEAESPFAAEG